MFYYYYYNYYYHYYFYTVDNARQVIHKVETVTKHDDTVQFVNAI